MEVSRCDKDQVMYKEKTNFEHQAVNEIKIVFSGSMMLQFSVDGKTECVVEYIGKGTIIDAHKFLG